MYQYTFRKRRRASADLQSTIRVIIRKKAGGERRRRMKKLAFTFLITLVPLALLAQGSIPALAVIPSPGFFTALIAGIIMAFGFQLILTNLSAAVGLSALHMGAEKVEKKIRSGSTEKRESKDPSGSISKTAREVNAAFGIWAIITASISLFFAAWLAVKISTPLNIFAGITLGLAIWGLFYIVTAVLEMTAVSSMVGLLMDLVRSGFRTFSGATSGMLRKSDEQKAADTAREIANAVRSELIGDINVRKTIQNYVDSLRPDYDQLRKEINSVLDDAEIDIKASAAEGMASARIHTGTAAPSPSEMKGKAEEAVSAVKGAAKTVSQEARSDKVIADKIADTLMEMAGMSRREAEQYRHKVEQYLAGTGKPELNPEGIKRDIDELVSGNTKAGLEGIMSRLSEFDRSTITSILAQREGMSRERADRIAGMVTGTVSTLKSGYRRIKGTAGTSAEQEEGRLESKMRGYFDSLDNPELHYSALKADFEEMLHNPISGGESMINRLKSISKHDMEQMVENSGLGISREDMDQVIGRIEQARDSLVNQADRMRMEAAAKIQRTEEETIHYADQARKVAASAAWWVFGAALVSGIAAAVGGLVGIMI